MLCPYVLSHTNYNILCKSIGCNDVQYLIERTKKQKVDQLLLWADYVIYILKIRMQYTYKYCGSILEAISILGNTNDGNNEAFVDCVGQLLNRAMS